MKGLTVNQSKVKFPIIIIGYTFIFLSIILLLIISYAIINTNVSIKYESDGGQVESWIECNITTLKVFWGYTFLSIIIAFLFIITNNEKKIIAS